MRALAWRAVEGLRLVGPGAPLEGDFLWPVPAVEAEAGRMDGHRCDEVECGDEEAHAPCGGFLAAAFDAEDAGFPGGAQGEFDGLGAGSRALADGFEEGLFLGPELQEAAGLESWVEVFPVAFFAG